jgi:hypothetical protein
VNFMNWFLCYLVGCPIIWVSSAFFIWIVAIRSEPADRERLAYFLTHSDKAATRGDHETFFTFLDTVFVTSFGRRRGRKACVAAALGIILFFLLVGIFFVIPARSRVWQCDARLVLGRLVGRDNLRANRRRYHGICFVWLVFCVSMDFNI